MNAALHSAKKVVSILPEPITLNHNLGLLLELRIHIDRWPIRAVGKNLIGRIPAPERQNDQLTAIGPEPAGTAPCIPLESSHEGLAWQRPSLPTTGSGLLVSFCLLTLLLFVSRTASATDFFVSATGSPAGDGSKANPWDLQSAFNHPAAVRPGDTLWLR